MLVCFAATKNTNRQRKRTISIYMNKTKKSKNYIAIIKYPHNEHLQTIITIRIQLGWVKRGEEIKLSITQAKMINVIVSC